MKPIYPLKLMAFVLSFFISTASFGQLIISTNTNWSAITSTPATDIIVNNGATLTMDVNGVCNSIQIGSNTGLTGNGNLLVNTGTLLTVSTDVTLGAGSFTGSIDMSGGGQIQIAGNFTAPALGTFTPGTGTIEYNGAAQTILSTTALGGAGHEYYNLTVSGGNTKTTGGPIAISNIITDAASTTLDLTADITLKSTAARTAQVAAVNGNITYTAGKFVVERFVAGHRAWRFLAVPISPTGAPTIQSSWMEGGQVTAIGNVSNLNPGFGTHITGGSVGNGFDQNPSGNSSVKVYNAGNYPGVTTTNTGSITDQPAYMIFVRGSRANSLTSGVNAVADNTTLRVGGRLNTGTQVFLGANATNSFLPVSNPYASAIQLPHTLDDNVTPMSYQVWDPLLTGSNGVGAYVTYSWGGFSYSVAPLPVSPFRDGIIESGSAFLLATSSPNLTINETDKVSGSAQVLNPTTAPGEQIRINLYALNTDGTSPLVDGAMINYNNNYSNVLDNYDAIKNKNFAENLGILRDGKILAIERRKIITGSESIFLSIEQMSWKNYRFDIIADNLDHPGMKAYLKDNFLGTQTLIELNGTTSITFTVSSDPATSATGRFSIEFSAPKPVQYTNVKAYRRATDIAVEWTVDNELNMQQYVVEHSADGTNFSAIASTSPTGNAYSHVTYTAADASSFSGDNFYRVKGTSVSGKVEYTTTVKVASLKTGNSITVYPNPITGNVINLQFIGQSAGSYQVRLYSADGQVVYSTPIMVVGGNSVQALPVNQQLAKGVYQLEVKNGADVKMSQKVIVQ